MESNRKRLLIIVIVLGLIGVISYQLFWVISLKAYPKEIRPALQRISKAYYINKILGGYWENEMGTQAQKISTLSQENRVAFFRGIMLITCDLDTSRATSFVHLLGKDAEALRKNLMQFKATEQFSGFSQKQQIVITDWIDELEIIIKQQKFDLEE